MPLHLLVLGNRKWVEGLALVGGINRSGCSQSFFKIAVLNNVGKLKG